MAKSTKSTNVQVNLELSIPQSDYAVFEEVAAPQPVEDYVKACVTNYLSAYANGGLMLSAEDLTEIGEASGNEVTSSSDIVEAVKSGAGKSTANSFQISVDPSLTVNIEDSAKFLGITPEQWVYNCWSHILANGWLYEVSNDVTWIPFSKDQCEVIRKAAGKDCKSSADFMDAVTAKSGVK
jgi:hypothetical protein